MNARAAAATATASSALSLAHRLVIGVPVSVVIPVKNEGHHLERCLRAVDWADEVIVIDSQSIDDTVAVAERCGATVVQFHYNGSWPKKKNWALEHLSFRHEWVLFLDADEVLPPAAAHEVATIVRSDAADVRGYWINRRFFFLDGWLEHAYYPNWNLRLVQHRYGRFERLTSSDTDSGDVEIHEHILVDGVTRRLASRLDHYAFPTVSAFVEKHNRYSNWEAHAALDAPATAAAPHLQVGRWRRRLKECARHLPCRPLLRFLYVYVGQGGFLDGRQGYYFARLHAFYEFLNVVKTFELRRRREGLRVRD